MNIKIQESNTGKTYGIVKDFLKNAASSFLVVPTETQKRHIELIITNDFEIDYELLEDSVLTFQEFKDMPYKRKINFFMDSVNLMPISLKSLLEIEKENECCINCTMSVDIE